MLTKVLIPFLWGVALLPISLASGRAAADGAEATASPLPAAAGAEAPAVTEEGFVLYRRGEYRRAAEKFLQAYALDADPNLLFNIARCYQTLGDTSAAIEKYVAFLANPGAGELGRRRAAEALLVLRQARSPAPPAGAHQAASAASGAGDADPATPPGVTGRAHQGRFTSFEIAGLALYRSHDYQHAAEKFLSAYALEADPNLLFDIARCYAALGDAAAAAEKYEAFLRSPGIEARDQFRAREALQKLRAAALDAAPGRAVASIPPVGPSRQKRTPAGRSGARAAWIVTGLLAAGTVAVGVAALESAAKLKSARDSFPADGDYLSQRAATTRVLTLSADALGAAAMIAGGVSLYLTVGRRAPAAEIKAEVGGGSFRLAGSF